MPVSISVDKFTQGVTTTTTPTRFTYLIPFMRPPGSHWQVSVAAHPGYESPPTYDSAPDSGTIVFDLPNRDGDYLADVDDPCPDAAFSQPPAPWVDPSQHWGCPSATAPFAGTAFATNATRTAKAFRRLWRKPHRRARALKHGRLDLAFQVPAGEGVVGMRVMPAVVRGPFRASVYGGRRCGAGRCVVHLKVSRRGVRAYAHKKLQLQVLFTVGSDRTRIEIAQSFRLRMPL